MTDMNILLAKDNSPKNTWQTSDIIIHYKLFGFWSFGLKKSIINSMIYSANNNKPELQPLDASLLADADIPPPQLAGGTATPEGIIISVPHAGRAYPKTYFSQNNLVAGRSLEDIGADIIALPLATESQPVLIANCCRALCDLNRPETALDPELIERINPSTDRIFTPHIKAGYGVIPRLSASKTPLHERALSSHEAENILSQWYRPYHEILTKLISIAEQKNNNVLLIDIHSMPAHQAHFRGTIPDFIFGNLYGATVPDNLVRTVDKVMAETSYNWNWNSPYAGGYITRHYGLPATSKSATVFVLQIEINRGLYTVDPFDIKTDKVAEITALIHRLSQKLKSRLH